MNDEAHRYATAFRIALEARLKTMAQTEGVESPASAPAGFV
jgi:hypothetical protein